MGRSRLMPAILTLALFSGVLPGGHGGPSRAGAAVENSCVGCHTNLKKLIRLIWKIEEELPKPQKSVQTSGEG